LLGLPTVTILATNDNPQALRTTAVNLFAQDDWRVTGRLTVNAGLRYELNTAPVGRGRSNGHLRSRFRRVAAGG
jgi:outer membrane receptor protein involved in Fe transport